MKIGINPSSQGYNVNGEYNEALGTNDLAHMVVEIAKEYNMDVKIYWGGNCKKGSSNIAGIKRSLTRAMKDKVDLFLSFHTDSAGDQNNDGRGYTGSLLLYKTTADKKFGETVVDHACRVSGIPFYASRKRTKLLVLSKTTGIPSCLIEIANHSDPDDVKLLLDPNWRRRYARGLVEGLVYYTGGQVSKPTPAKPKPAPKPSGPRDLKKPRRGEDIKHLQAWLNGHGFPCGKVDGIFGNKTDRAVRSFQRKAKLSVDGVVGPRTRAAMAIWVTPKPAPAKPKPEMLSLIKQGSNKKSLIRKAQGLLRTKGYPLAVDGIFGPRTKRATVRFQKAHGLSPDGIIGRRTWAKLLA